MRFDKLPKLLPIVDLEVSLSNLSGFGFDTASCDLALKPQVNCVATDIEQLTCFTFLETIQLDRLHHFLPEVVAVGFSHKEGRGKKTLLVYVLTLMNAAIADQAWKG